MTTKQQASLMPENVDGGIACCRNADKGLLINALAARCESACIPHGTSRYFPNAGKATGMYEEKR
jgi:hypothetical protein